MTLPHQQRIWQQYCQVQFSCGSNRQQDSTMLLISAGSLVYLPRRMPKLLKFPVKDCPSVQILIEYNGRFFQLFQTFEHHTTSTPSFSTESLDKFISIWPKSLMLDVHIIKITKRFIALQRIFANLRIMNMSQIQSGTYVALKGCII